MKFLLTAGCAALLMALAGCAVYPGTPFTGSQASDAALVHARWNRDGAFTWEGVRLLSLDGKFVETGPFSDPYTAVTKVDAGPRRLGVLLRFNRGIASGGPKEAYVVLQADLRARVSYQISANVTEAGAEIWLEEMESKRRVTEVGKAPANVSTEGTFTPTPIFIPSRK